MGQTLTHGIYLPDEGERNCYNGLAGNWQMLDGAVGTIAEHTSALAGKAPLVHTHTKSDITDFPVYGTTAGTICEGNDSRLSDARTPVAHTHTKSDVTDLLNSNFIPSTNNSYDLGSSSYQWNNIYSKGYYYNGVAWGLDKGNVWTGNNTFTNSFTLKNTSWSGKVPPSGVKTVEIPLSNSDTMQSRVMSRVSANSTETWITTVRNIDANTSYESTLIHVVDNNGNRKLQPLYGDVSLGAPDSGSRFKSFNGVNPGALSIFNPSATPDPISFPNGVNESGTWKYDGSAWNALNVSNLGDGWVIITYNACAAGDYILARFGGTGGSRYPSMIFKAEILAGSPTSAYLYAFFPVAKAFGNIYLEMKINSNANLVLHHFMPAYGTV